MLVMTGLHYDINADMKAAMLDVGQGDSIAVHTKDGLMFYLMEEARQRRMLVDILYTVI